MNPEELFCQKGLCIGCPADRKDEVLERLVSLLQEAGWTDRPRSLKKLLIQQEEQASSAIGAGVAIAQVRSGFVKSPGASAVTLPRGVDYGSPDGVPVRLAVLVALPSFVAEGVAARLSVLLLNEDLREQLTEAVDGETFLHFLNTSVDARSAGNERPLILALLDAKNDDARRAAAVLQQTADRRGAIVKIAFYQKGSKRPPFSPEELQEAKSCLLMGAIPPDPFDGKPMLRAGITDGIYRPEHLLNNVVKAPVFRLSFPKRKERVFQELRRLFLKKTAQNMRSHKVKK